MYIYETELINKQKLYYALMEKYKCTHDIIYTHQASPSFTEFTYWGFKLSQKSITGAI
jgi:hypothetical protein